MAVMRYVRWSTFTFFRRINGRGLGLAGGLCGFRGFTSTAYLSLLDSLLYSFFLSRIHFPKSLLMRFIISFGDIFCRSCSILSIKSD